jgi:hypothetical protein
MVKEICPIGFFYETIKQSFNGVLYCLVKRRDVLTYIILEKKDIKISILHVSSINFKLWHPVSN